MTASRASHVLGAGPIDRRRLATRVGVGVAIGALYAALDTWVDARMMSGRAAPHWITALHGVIDAVLPIVTGAVMGLAVHWLHLRAQAVAAEHHRAEELRGSLHKIERDQAVWIVAASLLHELRNPLHALGLLLDELGTMPADAAADREALLARARAQHDRITAELGALKALPATEAPELPRVDLSALVARFVADIGPLVQAERLRVEVRAPEPVLAGADAVYVRIILENLIENALDALREHGEGGVVEVSVTRADGRAVVRVRDDGPGVDDDTAAAIFEPLRTTKARGMGLGLAIARALARAMGGDLLLESARPAIFRLELCPP